MKRLLAIPSLVFLSSLSHAQISDGEAILIARNYLSVLAPEVLEESPRVLRDTMDVRGGSRDYMMVWWGGTMLSLRSDGDFIGFSNMSHEALERKDGQPDMYRTDEEAWLALEYLIAELAHDLDLPPGLERAEFKRLDSEGQDYVCRFYMRPNPYGYERSGGNYLAADVHRVTGRVRGLSVARGWTYEPPNVTFTSAQIIARAVQAKGGDPSDWRTDLKYMTMSYDRAPSDLKPLIAQQVMRLMYVATRGSEAIIFDSVTGSAVESLTAESIGQAESGVEPTNDSEVNTPKNGIESEDENSNTGNASLIRNSLFTVVGLGLVAYLVWYFRIRQKSAV